MSISTSPFLKLLFGLDESGATSPRANAVAANVGIDYTLDAYNQTTPEGLPTVDDEQGGKGVDVSRVPGAPWTTQYRALESQELALQDCLDDGTVQDPGDWTVDGEGFTLGMRLTFDLRTTGSGGSDVQKMFYFSAGEYDGRAHAGFFLRPDTNLSPSGGASLGMFTQSGSVSGLQAVDGANGWLLVSGVVPDQDDNYITDDGWYTVVCRQSYDLAANEHVIRAWIKNETTGLLLIFEKSTSLSGFDANSYTFPDQWRWSVGGVIGQPDMRPHYGYEDQCWYYSKALSDEEIESILISGISVPWTEPNYNRDPHEVHSAVTKENAAYPATRPLPTGGTIVRHPVDVHCQEIRARVEGWKAGEPWALRAADFVFDPAGPFGSQRARKGERPDLSIGVWRQPGRKPWGAAEDSRNMEYTYAGPRRRRGFKIRRDVDAAAPTGHNAFFSWRSYEDELFRAFKVGTALYLDTGGAANSIDTGWSTSEVPSSFFLDNRYIVLSRARRVLLDGTSTIQSFGAAPPASIVPLATGGGTLTGDYFYAATLYDPITGDETGPVVTAAVVSPANQKVQLTLPAAAPEPRFTKYRIYRTTNGGTAPTFFLILTEDVSATIDDVDEVDGTQLLPQVTDSADVFLGYITSTMPDTFSLGTAHKERAIYAKGGTNPERIYIGEPNEPLRIFASQWIAADGPVRAIVSWQGRIVVLTDNTVEIVESDFVRDADGKLNINRTVVSRSVGALGQGSVIVFQGQIFWLDRRGVFTLQGTEAVPITDRIQDLFPYINTNKGAQIVGGWNHLTRTLWWTLPLAAFQDDSSLMQTQFVMPLAEPEKWWFHSLEATFIGQFDDDLNGQRFGLIDHAGVFKELESYEGDGQEGDEAGTFEDEGTDDFGSTPAGITSIASSTIAVEGAPGWTTNEHRGKGLILRDRSTRKLYYHTIRSNTPAGLTVDRTPSAALAAGDGYYIGGMDAFLQLAGHDFGSANRKIVRQVQYTLADLTQEDLYR